MIDSRCISKKERTSDIEPPQLESMMRPYTTMLAKENQQPESAESGVKSRHAMGPSRRPNRTGSVEVVVIRFASKKRFRIGYPCKPVQPSDLPIRPRTDLEQT